MAWLNELNRSRRQAQQVNAARHPSLSANERQNYQQLADKGVNYDADRLINRPLSFPNVRIQQSNTAQISHGHRFESMTVLDRSVRHFEGPSEKWKCRYDQSTVVEKKTNNGEDEKSLVVDRNGSSDIRSLFQRQHQSNNDRSTSSTIPSRPFRRHRPTAEEMIIETAMHSLKRKANEFELAAEDAIRLEIDDTQTNIAGEGNRPIRKKKKKTIYDYSDDIPMRLAPPMKDLFDESEEKKEQAIEIREIAKKSIIPLPLEYLKSEQCLPPLDHQKIAEAKRFLSNYHSLSNTAIRLIPLAPSSFSSLNESLNLSLLQRSLNKARREQASATVPTASSFSTPISNRTNPLPITELLRQPPPPHPSQSLSSIAPLPNSSIPSSSSSTNASIANRSAAIPPPPPPPVHQPNPPQRSHPINPPHHPSLNIPPPYDSQVTSPSHSPHHSRFAGPPIQSVSSHSISLSNSGPAPLPSLPHPPYTARISPPPSVTPQFNAYLTPPRPPVKKEDDYVIIIDTMPRSTPSISPQLSNPPLPRPIIDEGDRKLLHHTPPSFLNHSPPTNRPSLPLNVDNRQQRNPSMISSLNHNTPPSSLSSSPSSRSMRLSPPHSIPSPLNYQTPQRSSSLHNQPPPTSSKSPLPLSTHHRPPPPSSSSAPDRPRPYSHSSPSSSSAPPSASNHVHHPRPPAMKPSSSTPSKSSLITNNPPPRPVPSKGLQLVPSSSINLVDKAPGTRSVAAHKHTHHSATRHRPH